MSNVLNGFEQPESPDNNDNAVFFDGELIPQRIGYTITPGASNVCEIKLEIKDGHGKIIESGILLTIWLSDDSGGVGLTATSASGTVQAKSGEGADFGILTAKKALVVQSKADGSYTLEITDTAKTGFYISASLPTSGLSVISRQLVTGDYGA